MFARSLLFLGLMMAAASMVSGQPAGDLKAFAGWVVSKEGQKVVENVGYYPLNEKDRQASVAKLSGGGKQTAKAGGSH